MATMNAFYVRKISDDAMSVIQNLFSSVKISSNVEFLAVLLEHDATEQELRELSSYLETAVFGLSFQSVVDAFEYYHWHKGVLLRALVYGCIQERTWERVEGQEESWEKAAFFDLETLEDILADEESEEEKEQLKQFWQAGELVIGRMEPYLGARRVALEIASYYGFPRWD